MHVDLLQCTISEVVCFLSPVSMLSFTMHSPASRAASQGRSKPTAGITIQSPGTSSSELTHSSSGKTNKHSCTKKLSKIGNIVPISCVWLAASPPVSLRMVTFTINWAMRRRVVLCCRNKKQSQTISIHKTIN